MARLKLQKSQHAQAAKQHFFPEAFCRCKKAQAEGTFPWGFCLGQKGQAAVTDALYFLLIVTGLAVFLFHISNSFGNTIATQISLSERVDYSTSALKTILYSSTPRHPNEQLVDDSGQLDRTIEIDHLLAFVKEDYADDLVLNKEAIIALSKTIESIMLPLGDSFDYLFYIYKPGEGQFIFLMFHVNTLEQSGRRGEEVKPGQPINFICGISGLTTSGVLTIQKVQKLIVNVGLTSRASARILILEQLRDSEPVQKTAQADLIMWPTVNISQLFNKNDWGCADLESIETQT